jgi:hypothetical protein
MKKQAREKPGKKSVRPTIPVEPLPPMQREDRAALALLDMYIASEQMMEFHEKGGDKIGQEEADRQLELLAADLERQHAAELVRRAKAREARLEREAKEREAKEKAAANAHQNAPPRSQDAPGRAGTASPGTHTPRRKRA